MSLLPENDKRRKLLPMFHQIARYFPKALREITKVSVVNNVRYSPDREPADINWARQKSKDQLGSAFHHMLESAVDGKVFEDVPEPARTTTGVQRVFILAEAAWRINAALELAIEEAEAKYGPDCTYDETLNPQAEGASREEPNERAGFPVMKGTTGV